MTKLALKLRVESDLDVLTVLADQSSAINCVDEYEISTASWPGICNLVAYGYSQEDLASFAVFATGMSYDEAMDSIAVL